MAPLSRAGALAAALLLAACSADKLTTSTPATPESPARLDAGTGKLAKAGVGTLGKIVSVNPNKDTDNLRHLVLLMSGFEVKAPDGTSRGHHALPPELEALGGKHAQLQVHIDDSTKFIVKGDTLADLGDLLADSLVLVVGRVTGASLHATVISDLTGLQAASPQPAGQAANWRVAPGAAPRRALVAPASDPTSMCVGQDLNYTDPNVVDFQGCWGGPSASKTWDVGFIPLFCPIFGCFGIDQTSFDGGLGGWGFAFPFKLSATPTAPLVYHKPGTVQLKVEPQSDGNAQTFWGGIGFDFGLNFDYCFFKCWDLGWVYVGLPFSMMYTSYDNPPLPNDTLHIRETSCPSIAIIPIENFPLNPLELGVCVDLEGIGAPFNTTVFTTGASPGHSQRFAFDAAARSWLVRPDAPSVSVTYNDFRWTPDLEMGLYLRLKSFSIKLFDTPSIPLASGWWGAITNPFPDPNALNSFSVATDPSNTNNHLHQPTSHTVLMGVQPGKSLITITSAQLLPEGTAVTAWLREEYDGSGIGDQLVTFEAQGLNGTVSVTVLDTTDAGGMTSMVLPVGEYTVTARFDGKSMMAGGAMMPVLLPSTDTDTPVYVYRPTTFVIWGGNAGGITVGGRHQFWGSGWWKQVIDGNFGGNASFLGYALLPEGATDWASPPASSGRGPAQVPDVIGVIVTTQVAQRGSNLSGNVASHAILRVEDPAGYRPDGGHGAWGVVRALAP